MQSRGIGGGHHQDLRNRPISWWRDWLSRDPVYSSQPYAHLAGVLAAAGNRDGAADIRFFGRDRERSELLRGCTWLQKPGLLEKPDDTPCDLRQWGPWLGMSALQVFVGYGIGNYSFRAAAAPVLPTDRSSGCSARVLTAAFDFERESGIDDNDDGTRQ